MLRVSPALVLFGTLLAGCATRPVPGPGAVIEAPVSDLAWRRLATDADQLVVDRLGDDLRRARAAIPRRMARAAASEGALLDDAAQLLPALPPGPYYCRLVRLGGRRGFVTFPPDQCYVGAAQDALAFTKQTGSNLPEGYIYADGEKRAVLLGTFRTAEQPDGARYGEDPARSIVGLVERVSSFRWRLILSRAGGGAALDLYELVPVPPQVPGARPAVPTD